MNEATDSSLLRCYADSGDDAAFAEVVRRHVNLVYSAALRLTGGQAPLAEDVTQAVFTELARQAGPLAGRATLTGWLHTATRYLASKAVRSERRRQLREHEAGFMHNESSTTEFPWEQLCPVLDEAVGQLSGGDRDLVLLRFFEGKSHGESGAILGISEDTARKRVERAVEKLRTYFGRRGVTISAGLLTAAMTNHAVQAAPAKFAGGVAVASLAHAATGFAGVLPFAFSMTTKTKLLLAAAAAVAVAVVPFALLQMTDAGGPDANTRALPTSSTSTRPSKPSPAVAAPRLPPTAATSSPPSATVAGPSNLAAANEAAARLALLAASPANSAKPLNSASSAANNTSRVAPGFYADPATPLGQRITALVTGAPVTINPDLEIWDPDPARPNSRHIRPDIVQIPLHDPMLTSPRDDASGTAYYLPVENRFYLVWEKSISSTFHWYGPFAGDPRVVLGLPPEPIPQSGPSNYSSPPIGNHN